VGTFRKTRLKRAQAAPRVWLGSVLALGIAAILLAVSPAPVWADLTDTTTTTTTTDTSLQDPLLGYCTGCAENSANTNRGTLTDPISKFGFTVSPSSTPSTGDFRIEILVPNNEDTAPASLSYHITGTAEIGTTPHTVTATAHLAKTSAWTIGNLAPFLGLSANPTNPIGAYIGCTLCADHYDHGVTGFYVYEVDLGKTTLQGMNDPGMSPLLNITEQLQRASYVLGFLNIGSAKKQNWIATANSGAILAKVPEPASLMLLSFGLMAFGVTHRLRRRRRLAGQLIA
jgi:hypothetical protein